MRFGMVVPAAAGTRTAKKERPMSSDTASAATPARSVDQSGFVIGRGIDGKRADGKGGVWVGLEWDQRCHWWTSITRRIHMHRAIFAS